MTRAIRTAKYTGATTLCLYLAFELGSNEWKLGFTTEPGATPRVRTMPAREVGWTGCPQAARDAAALPRGRARRVERGARAHGRGGGSAPAASRTPDLEAGTHSGGEPDERPAREPGPLAAAGHRCRGRG